MKLFGIIDLTQKAESLFRVIALAIVTVVAVITAILSSFMITEEETKERNWWIALMSISWVAFLGTAAATVIAGISHRKFMKNRAEYEQVLP